MFGKIFDSMYDGTIAEDWRALVTFQQMIVLCDADGTIDMTPSAISRKTGIPIEHIKAGIEVLENPDPYSRTPDEEGRRIVKTNAGWFLPTYTKWQGLPKPTRPTASEWAETRTRIFYRDGFVCAYCLQLGGNLECDHIHPVALGGTHDDENLTTACRSCNRSKGSKTLSEWQSWRALN